MTATSDLFAELLLAILVLVLQHLEHELVICYGNRLGAEGRDLARTDFRFYLGDL